MTNRTRRQLLKGLAGTAGLLAANTGWTQSPSQSAANAATLPAIGSLLELPEVALFDGSVFRPAQARNQILVIYWWASWCPFCALQSPYMDKLWRDQRANGLQMLTLSIDRKPEDATAYLKKKGYVFPAGQMTTEVARSLPKPKGLPVTLVRGRDGRVLMAESGQLFQEDADYIAALL